MGFFCFLYHLRTAFTILGLSYSAAITVAGSSVQVKPRLSVSLGNPLARKVILIAAISGCCSLYGFIRVQFCGGWEFCPYLNMFDCSRLLIIAIGVPIISVKFLSCCTLMGFAMTRKVRERRVVWPTSIADDIKRERPPQIEMRSLRMLPETQEISGKDIQQPTKSQSAANATETTKPEQTEEDLKVQDIELEIRDQVFVISCEKLQEMTQSESQDGLTQDEKSKDVKVETCADPSEIQTLSKPKISYGREDVVTKEGSLATLNKAEKVLGIQNCSNHQENCPSNTTLIKITTYQVSFLIATVIGLPYVVVCGKFPNSCPLYLGPMRTVTFTTFVPLFWAISNKEFRDFINRIARNLFQTVL